MGPLNSHDFSVFYLTFSPRFSVPNFRVTPRVVRLPELLGGFQGIPRAQRSAGSQPGGGENAMLAMGFATWGTITRGKEVMFMDLFSRRIYFCEDSLFNTSSNNLEILFDDRITCVHPQRNESISHQWPKGKARKSSSSNIQTWGKICNPSQRGTVYPQGLIRLPVSNADKCYEFGLGLYTFLFSFPRFITCRWMIQPIWKKMSWNEVKVDHLPRDRVDNCQTSFRCQVP